MKPFLDRLGRFFLDVRVAYAAPLVVAAVAAVQMMVQTVRNPLPGGMTHFNNYLIFRQAFVHLRAGQNLYLDFPDHVDNFLYSPTFATLMAPFAALPVRPGLVLWDLLNAAVLVAGVRALPGLDGRARALFVWFLLPEFVGSAQHSQTNPGIAGLLLLAFAMAERRRAWAAALFLVLAGYVKIFPLAAGLLFLAYPERVRLVLWTGAWTALLALVPLLVVPPAELGWQYVNWYTLHTTSRHVEGMGMSAETLLRAVAGWVPPRGLLLVVAGLLTALPLTNVRAMDRTSFRGVLAGALLMWMIAFNHLSESPTFIIAMAGVGLWYFSQASTPFHRALLWMAFLLVSVTYSDLVPPGFRARFIHPYGVKVFPVVVIWAVAVAQLTLRRGVAPPPRST